MFEKIGAFPGKDNRSTRGLNNCSETLPREMVDQGKRDGEHSSRTMGRRVSFCSDGWVWLEGQHAAELLRMEDGLGTAAVG